MVDKVHTYYNVQLMVGYTHTNCNCFIKTVTAREFTTVAVQGNLMYAQCGLPHRFTVRNDKCFYQFFVIIFTMTFCFAKCTSIPHSSFLIPHSSFLIV